MSDYLERFQFGPVSASIFENEVQTSNGTMMMRTVSLQKSYFDKVSDEFKTTNSYNANDIPKAVIALVRAYEYILSLEKKESSQKK